MRDVNPINSNLADTRTLDAFDHSCKPASVQGHAIASNERDPIKYKLNITETEIARPEHQTECDIKIHHVNDLNQFSTRYLRRIYQSAFGCLPSRIYKRRTFVSFFKTPLLTRKRAIFCSGPENSKEQGPRFLEWENLAASPRPAVRDWSSPHDLLRQIERTAIRCRRSRNRCGLGFRRRRFLSSRYRAGTEARARDHPLHPPRNPFPIPSLPCHR